MCFLCEVYADLYACEFLWSIQDYCDVVLEAKKATSPQPVVIVRGDEFKDLKDAHIPIEGQLLCSVPLDNVPYYLLCTFNLQYTHACTNFYSFLEFLFLGVNPPKRSTLRHFITGIQNTV